MRLRFAGLALLACVLPFAAVAQDGPERCPQLVAAHDGPIRVVPVAFTPVQADGSAPVTLTFIGHATFLIESPAGVTIATDYNGAVKPLVVPRIVTMNRAHTTHYTLTPEPEIEYVLHGWGENGVPAAHELTVDDVWLRNVTTNIRGGFGQSGAIQRDMNSMFVFEVAGLCILQLGHLHHELTADHLKALGRIDVVLAPVDGSVTLQAPEMVKVLNSIRPSVVIPMHFFASGSLERFLTLLDEDDYAIDRSSVSRVTLSRNTLPPRPTVLVLPGF